MTREQIYHNYVEFIIRNATTIKFDNKIDFWWGNIHICHKNMFNDYYIEFDFNYHLYEILPWMRIFSQEDDIIRDIIENVIP